MGANGSTETESVQKHENEVEPQTPTHVTNYESFAVIDFDEKLCEKEASVTVTQDNTSSVVSKTTHKSVTKVTRETRNTVSENITAVSAADKKNHKKCFKRRTLFRIKNPRKQGHCIE